MDDRYSLGNLRDIMLPDPPPIWPLAPEMWLLLAIVVASVLFVVYQWRRARRRNAYRRAGLLLLNDAGTVRDVSVVLKRVALAVFPREQVASLYGDDWARFLGRTCPRREFALFAEGAFDAPVSPKVRRLARTWIRHHRALRPYTNSAGS